MMNLIGKLFGGNRRAKTLLRKLPIREKTSTLKEVDGWDSGFAYPRVEVVTIDQAVRILGEHLREKKRGEFISCDGDRIKYGYGSDSYSGVRTILRVGKQEFVVHRYCSD